MISPGENVIPFRVPTRRPPSAAPLPTTLADTVIPLAERRHVRMPCGATGTTMRRHTLYGQIIAYDMLLDDGTYQRIAPGLLDRLPQQEPVR